jgi:GNAT superfamily N-acetyltransferase
MHKRTEQQKEQRKIKEEKNRQEYKKFYQSHLEVIKECKKCGIKKPLSEFLDNFSHRHICKQCHKEKIDKWRKENRAEYADIAKRGRIRSSTFIRSLKEGRLCTHCQKPFPPYMLDFHHLHDKEWTISKLYGKSPERILKEIDKCITLCVNCHREETQKEIHNVPVNKNRRYAPEIIDTPITEGDETKLCIRCDKEKHVEDFKLRKTGKRFTYCNKCTREYNRKTAKNRKNKLSKEVIRKIKHMATCADCHHAFPYWVMDADHFGTEKNSNLNKLQNNSIQKINDELSLCDLVCANCHRKRTWKWRQQAKSCICGYTPKSSADEAKHIKLCPMRTEAISDLAIITKLLNNTTTVKTGDIHGTQRLLDKYHYAGYGRTASVIYTAIYDGEIIAIIKFSPPVRKEVATSLGWQFSEVLELDRFCILPQWQVKNLASKVMAQAIKLVRNDFPNVVVLISFADLERGHIGTIYKASNWTHIGMTANPYTYINKDGDEINKKTIYNRAKSNGMKEKEYASREGLLKIKIGKKEKFVYELR